MLMDAAFFDCIFRDLMPDLVTELRDRLLVRGVSTPFALDARYRMTGDSRIGEVEIVYQVFVHRDRDPVYLAFRFQSDVMLNSQLAPSDFVKGYMRYYLEMLAEGVADRVRKGTWKNELTAGQPEMFRVSANLMSQERLPAMDPPQRPRRIRLGFAEEN